MTMGNGESAEMKQIRKLEEDRVNSEAEHKAEMEQMKKMLANAEKDRQAAAEEVRKVNAKMEEEKVKSQAKIDSLNDKQDKMLAKVDALIASFKRQEDQFKQQLDAANEKNEQLTRRIDELLAQMQKERDDHKAVMADYRAKAEELITKLMTEAGEERKANRGLLENINVRLDKNDNRTRRSVDPDVMTKAENLEEGAKIRRSICRAEKLLMSTIRVQMNSVVHIVRGKGMAGPILADIVRAEKARRGGREKEGCGAGGSDWNANWMGATVTGVTVVPHSIPAALA